MTSVSVIVPTFNMAEHLQALWQSLLLSETLKIVDEVIFVDDGSTDDTVKVIESLRQQPSGEKVKIVALIKNQGRFQARWAGGKAAKGEALLFMDARVELKEDFGQVLSQSLKHSLFIQPQSLIDVQRNWFCLYWVRSHEWIFSRHFKAMKQGPFELTSANYDHYLKGTTALIAPRLLFNQTCQALEQSTVLSDDTLVMKKMVESVPLRLDPQLLVRWIPRETFWAFLLRLVDRGPGLVEYHVFIRRGWIFAAISVGLLMLFAIVVLLFFSPQISGLLLILIFAAIIVSARLMAQSTIESLRLLPLHAAVIVSVSLGVLWGLWVNTRRWIKGEFQTLQA